MEKLSNKMGTIMKCRYQPWWGAISSFWLEVEREEAMLLMLREEVYVWQLDPGRLSSENESHAGHVGVAGGVTGTVIKILATGRNAGFLLPLIPLSPTMASMGPSLRSAVVRAWKMNRQGQEPYLTSREANNQERILRAYVSVFLLRVSL